MVIILALQHLTTADWIMIVVILMAALIALGVYTWSLYGRIPKEHTPLIGQEAVVTSWDGRDRRVEVFGATWAAHMPESYTQTITPGDIVIVRAIDNLVLIVTPTGEKI
ncbi:MAG TPA: NfeD family protein [Alphaproteobacteria bacterium]